MVGGGAVVVVTEARLVVDTPAVTVGVGGSVVTDGADVEESNGLDVEEDSGRVVVERLADGSVGRLAPDPPQAAVPSKTTMTPITASARRRAGFGRSWVQPSARLVLRGRPASGSGLADWMMRPGDFVSRLLGNMVPSFVT